MDTKLENYYAGKSEPYQGCLLALRHIITSFNSEIVHERKFQIPFFTYKGKKLGYLWLNRKKLMVGFCLDKRLLPVVKYIRPKDKYESFEVDPEKDLPVELIREKLGWYLGQIDKSS